MRPTGVTVVAILYAIGGVLSIVGGALSIATISTMSMYGGMVTPASVTLAPMFGVFILIGAISLLIAWGLWKGKSWSWWIVIIFSVLGIIGGIVNIAGFGMMSSMMPMMGALFSTIGLAMGLVQIAINGLIIYYFTRPHVKAFFNV
jgi:hypothetical protein